VTPTAPDRPAEELTGLRAAGAVAVMLSGNTLTALIFTALSPVLPEIAAHFATRGGAFIAQLIMSMPGLGVIVGGLLAGLVVERLGARRALFAALLLYAVSGTALLYLADPWFLLATRFLVGAAAALSQTALIILISATFSEARRAKIIGFSSAVGYSAAIGTTLISGATAELAGWRAPAGLYLLSLLVLAVAWICLPRTSGAAAPLPAGERPPLSGLRPLLPIYVLTPVLYALNYMLAIQFAFLLADNGVASPAVKSWIMAAGSVWGVLGAASSGWIRERLGSNRLFGIMTLLMGSGYVVIGLSHDPVTSALGAGIAGLGGGMVVPTLVNAVVSQAPAAVRNRAVGLVYSTAYMGEFVNPILLNPIQAALGIHGVFLAMGPLLALGGLFAFASRRRGAAAAV
jgi:MFS family permease